VSAAPAAPRENAVKRRLAKGELLLGTFVMEFASPGSRRSWPRPGRIS
jgi:hypothetical protein